MNQLTTTRKVLSFINALAYLSSGDSSPQRWSVSCVLCGESSSRWRVCPFIVGGGRLRLTGARRPTPDPRRGGDGARVSFGRASSLIYGAPHERARAKRVYTGFDNPYSIDQCHTGSLSLRSSPLHSRASPPARQPAAMRVPAAHVCGVSHSELPALTHWPLVTQRARCEHPRKLPVF